MNIDKEEILKFEADAHEWWNDRGPYKILHKINPLRIKFITERINLKGLAVLDIGCGGGLLSEELVKKGALVTGIDASKKTILVAKRHAKESNFKIDYQCIAFDEYVKKTRKKFDCVICFELIEHVKDPEKLLKDINNVSKKNSKLFLSTINRNIQSFIFAKILAEYFLKIIPKGTHKYEKFVKPSEISEILEPLNYTIEEVVGMIFNPLILNFELSSFTNVNYFLYAEKNKKQY